MPSWRSRLQRRVPEAPAPVNQALDAFLTGL